MRTVTSLSIVIHCRLMYSCAHQHTCEGVNKATEPRPLLQQHTIQVLPLPIFCILETHVCLLQERRGRGGEREEGGRGEGGGEREGRRGRGGEGGEEREGGEGGAGRGGEGGEEREGREGGAGRGGEGGEERGMDRRRGGGEWVDRGKIRKGGRNEVKEEGREGHDKV